jgi:hypothetical protein
MTEYGNIQVSKCSLKFSGADAALTTTKDITASVSINQTEEDSSTHQPSGLRNILVS